MKILVTGTNVYGPRREDSDIDVVMHEDDAYAFERALREDNFEDLIEKKVNAQGENYDGFTLYLGGDFPAINIIALTNDDELEKWKYATDELKKLPPIEDRTQRLYTFRKFCGETK